MKAGYRVISLAAAVSMVVLASCDLMKYHPYAPYFDGDSDLTDKNVKAIESLCLGDSYKFAFISDTQRRYDDTDDAVADINARGDIDFVIHGGDLTDFGVTEEFVWMRDCLSSLNMPYLTVIGNHDFLGNGEFIYQEMYGEFNYALTVGHVRYLMINTVALELDYSTPVPDFVFIERERDYVNAVNEAWPDSINRTVFVMHSRPGDEQFNNNVVLPFGLYLKMFPNPVCMNGHNHRFERLAIYDGATPGDSIYFYGVGAIKDRGYYVFTINKDSYDVEKVSF